MCHLIQWAGNNIRGTKLYPPHEKPKPFSRGSTLRPAPVKAGQARPDSLFMTISSFTAGSIVSG
ncbi:MAG TPA: hypothetical protein VF204_24790 [Streptosporangiaceae bacterium]